jgi:Leucine-rich repeat (LRR) protein
MAKQLREYSRQTSQRKSADLNSSFVNHFEIEEDLEEEFKDILSSIVNEDYIVSVTGIKDLSKVEYISLQIDTKEQALYDLSDILPNLKHLVLDNSHIGSIRDLGTGLRLITSLSLSGCNLRDLDGIGVLVGLQELCLSDNLLSDISPLTLHENLEVSDTVWIQ